MDSRTVLKLSQNCARASSLRYTLMPYKFLQGTASKEIYYLQAHDPCRVYSPKHRPESFTQQYSRINGISPCSDRHDPCSICI